MSGPVELMSHGSPLGRDLGPSYGLIPVDRGAQKDPLSKASSSGGFPGQKPEQSQAEAHPVLLVVPGLKQTDVEC